MATGVPKRGRKSAKVAARPEPENAGLRLEYPGKRIASEILSSVAAPNLATMWAGGAKDHLKRLYYADNLAILSSLRNDASVNGKVRLIYIDPPFSTQSVFHSRKLTHAYEDTLNGSDFVEYLRMRLILLRELLSPDGSIYLHLDEKMIFHVKIVLDEIFGARNFRNFITRKKCNPKNYTRKTFGNVSDYILFYTKSDEYVWHRPVESWTPERAAKEYEYTHPTSGRKYKKVPIHAPGTRNGQTGKPWRGMLPPPGKHWQFTPATLDEMDARGEIYWSQNGNPRRIVFLDQSVGVGVQDIWLDFRDAHNQNIRITGYPTEKPLGLLDRIIRASSDAGDIVLDCFSGSGTTLVQADNLDRRWIGIDNSSEAIRTTLRRFLVGSERMGDFVNHRNGDASEAPETLGTLPLFKSEQTRSRKHIPVSDFELIVEKGMPHTDSLQLPKFPGFN
jgi:adenine-specific DNA-methyltransferase